jgi:uncharacterized protein YijF (DUF1287 family)
VFLLLVMSGACSKPGPEPEAARHPGAAAPPAAAAPGPGGDTSAATATAKATSPEPAQAVAGETCLGVTDTGIWSDLDDQIQLALPAALDPARVTARLDLDRRLLLLAVDGVAAKPYPLSGDATLELGEHRLAVRPGDRAELAALLAPERVTVGAATDDKDKDGLPDALDVLIGAKKTVANADAYGAGYISIDYPLGDVPRDVGVCTDVVIRAMRNAGVDLQAEVHRDIGRARSAYPMVKRNGDTNIDHRRVRTILPWFKRHWDERTIALDDTADPLRPGDVVFMDTFPSKSGPDHIGIISDKLGESGHPLVVNNWTDGYHTSEMDLLGFVPITHRFRIQ